MTRVRFLRPNGELDRVVEAAPGTVLLDLAVEFAVGAEEADQRHAIFPWSRAASPMRRQAEASSSSPV